MQVADEKLACMPNAPGMDGGRSAMGQGSKFDDFTRVARATARWLRQARVDPSVVIGYDSMGVGRSYAEHVARIMASEGSRVMLSHSAVPTPAISWATRTFRCDAGIVVTTRPSRRAHNGFMVKTRFGSPATPSMIGAIRDELCSVDANLGKALHYIDLCKKGQIRPYDILGAYLDTIADRIDLGAIRASGMRVVHDASNGAGRGILHLLLGGQHVIDLRDAVNPESGGPMPYPGGRNVLGLGETIVREGHALGIAHDGDGGRVGVVGENGFAVDTHLLLALLVRYLREDRGFRGAVVKTFSMSHVLERVGRAYGLEVVTTPLGFRHIVATMIEKDVLIGGEESGGFAVAGHLPDRDGIYVGLLVLEMMARKGKTIFELVKEIVAEFGSSACVRQDYEITVQGKSRILSRLEKGNGLQRIGGREVVGVDTIDGYKYLLDGEWILVRSSRTEPVLRIYSEAADRTRAEELVNDVASQLGLDG